MLVYINGTEVEMGSTFVSYDDVVAKAKMKGWPSVTFYTSDDETRGNLSPGCSVTLLPGMFFNVYHTG